MFYGIEADLTPSLRVGEFCARAGQILLSGKRVRMRGAEDSPSPLDHVLHDGLGFEQVVACVERPVAAWICVVLNTGQSRVHSGLSWRAAARSWQIQSVRS